MKTKLLFLLTLTLVGASLFTACSNDDDDDNNKYNYKSPASILLSSHSWVTTQVLNQDGLSINFTDSIVSPYVGYAYYKSNGDFRIVGLDDTNKIYGQWMLTHKDKNRHLNVYDSFNKIAYTIDAEILTLNDSVFTYRLRYDNKNSNKYLDVVHAVTKHGEPKTPAQVFTTTSMIWKTTKIYNISSFYLGNKGDVSNNPIDPAKLEKEVLDKVIDSLVPLDKDLLPQSKYAGKRNYGDAQVASYFATTQIAKKDYFTNGPCAIFDVNNSGALYIKEQGYWYISLDGKYRTIYVVDNKKLVSYLVVAIAELSPRRFVYDVMDEGQVYRVISEIGR